MVKPPEHLDRFESLIKVVETLRGPNGCPWDKEQTHRTLTPYAIEEAFELAEAIDSGNREDLIGELGDVLLQVVLHSEIGRQEGQFTLGDVIRTLNEKMIRRHPHVFSTTEVSGSEEVLMNWAQIKAQEKKPKPADRFDIPAHLPSLQKAEKIGRKTRDVRFDWSDWRDVMAKVDEEMLELKEALESSDRDSHQHELGDVLFSLAQLARHLKLDSEQSLRLANRRFETRYFHMLQMIQRDGKELSNLPPNEMEEYWQKTKRELENAKGTAPD